MSVGRGLIRMVMMKKVMIKMVTVFFY